MIGRLDHSVYRGYVHEEENIQKNVGGEFSNITKCPPHTVQQASLFLWGDKSFA